MSDHLPYTVISDGNNHTVMHGKVPVAHFNGSFAMRALALQTADKLNEQDNKEAKNV